MYDENEEKPPKLIEEKTLNDFFAIRNKITFERRTRNPDKKFRKARVKCFFFLKNYHL